MHSDVIHETEVDNRCFVMSFMKRNLMTDVS